MRVGIRSTRMENPAERAWDSPALVIAETAWWGATMKRTNYKQEKRLKELEKQRKKDAKKERKLLKEQVVPESESELESTVSKPEEEPI